MTKLSELLTKYDRYRQEEQKDPYPSGETRTVLPEHKKELEEVSAITPPSIGWRIFLILFCVICGIIMANSPEYEGGLGNFYFVFCTVPPTIALTVTYFTKKGVYNRRMERKWELQHQINEIEDYNNTLEQNQKTWEERKNKRNAQIRLVISEASKLIASKEYFYQFLQSDHTDEVENELAVLCNFLRMNKDISISDTYLIRSIDIAQDIINALLN